MFFNSMPTLRYKVGDKSRIVTDIFTRIIVSKYQNTKLAIDSYYVEDGERPEHISYNFYGSSYYHWVILMVNNIVDVPNEWPKPTNSIFDYVEDKYGVGNASDVHHYILKEDVNGNEVEEEIYVDYNASDLASGVIQEVSNYNYELELNESKRQIYLLKPQYLGEFLNTYKRLLAV